MQADEYLTDRVDQQIRWLSDKSQRNQHWFKRLRLIEIAAACSIPFVVNLPLAADRAPIAAGLLGVVVAVIAGVLTLYRLQETWIEYRTTAEALKRQRFLFLTQSPPYQTQDRFERFVDTIEAILGQQNAAWTENTGKTGAAPPQASAAPHGTPG